MSNLSNLFTDLDKTKKFTWIAHERYWVPKERTWYIVYGALFISIILLLAILQEYILIIAVLAFTFLWFIQATIPPEQTIHEINTFGVKTFGKLYRWKFIKHFWFSRKQGIEYLNLEIAKNNKNGTYVPQRISLLMENNEMDEIFLRLIDLVDYGDQNEIGINFLTDYLHGKYVPITEFLPEETPTQEEYLAFKNFGQVDNNTEDKIDEQPLGEQKEKFTQKKASK